MIHGFGGLKTRLLPDGAASRILATKGVTAIKRPVSYPCHEHQQLESSSHNVIIARYHSNQTSVGEGEYFNHNHHQKGKESRENTKTTPASKMK